MGTYLPVPGAVPTFASRYVDEALGFTLSWNYWVRTPRPPPSLPPTKQQPPNSLLLPGGFCPSSSLPNCLELAAMSDARRNLGLLTCRQYQLAIGVPIEVTVSALIVEYWPNSVPVGAWVTIFWIPMVVINLFPVRVYGEAEFVFGAIKITTIIGLILLMLIITCGGAPNGDAIGFRYWRNPGAMNEVSHQPA